MVGRMLSPVKALSAKLDRIPKERVSFVLYFVLIVQLCVQVTYYYINRQHQFIDLSVDTPLSRTFTPGSESLNYVLVACVGSVATGMAMSLDLLLDVTGCGLNDLIDDRFERAVTVGILSIPSLFLILERESPSMAGLFALCHSNQLTICFGSVVMLCHRLYPESFTNTRTSLAVILFAICGVSSLIGFGFDETALANHLTFPFFASSFAAFGYSVYCWLVDEKLLKDYRILRIYGLKSKEIYTLSYLISMTVTILVAGMWGVKVRCIWTLLKVDDALVFVYCVAAYSVLINSIPGRVAKSLAIELQGQLISDKRTLIRYICHEIRSPVNVMKSNLDFMGDDLKQLLLVIAKIGNDIRLNSHLPIVSDLQTMSITNISSCLEEMKVACAAAVDVLDDILHLESIDAQSFRLQRSYLPLHSTFSTQLAKQGMIFAKQKGLHLIVRDEVQNNISNGQEEEWYLLADPTKLQQVIRNLVVNAVKFTGAGGDVTLTMRLYDDNECVDGKDDRSLIIEQKVNHNVDSTTIFRMDDKFYKLVDYTLSTQNESHSSSDDHFKQKEQQPLLSNNQLKKSYDSQGSAIDDEESQCQQQDQLDHNDISNDYQFTNQYVVMEVTDSGAGLSPDFLKVIFGEFAQFKPMSLQKGGGSGLGLWICREITKLHNGRLGCFSRGEGTGATFFLHLPLYKKRNIAMNPSLSIRTQSFQDQLTPTVITPKSNDSNSSRSTVFAAQTTTDGPLEYSCKTMPSLPSLEKILIVDDSDTNRKVLTRTVKRVLEQIHESKLTPSTEGKKYIIDEVDDGIPALEKIKQSLQSENGSYSIVFMDNLMIKMNGPQASQQMRAAGFTGKIIGVTGNALPADIREYKEAGADIVLKKPIQRDQITKLLQCYTL